VTRVGVVADSHVGECLPVLPPGVAERLAGVDLILHAGDITDTSVLRHLEELAPVVAVQGDHDREGGIVLPQNRVIRVSGRRIGLTHGRRVRAVEVAAAAASLVSGRPRLLGFQRALRQRFADVDCIVHGHLHIPLCGISGAVLFFSPGAVYVPEGDPSYGTGLRGRVHLGFRRKQAPETREPAVGLLEVAKGRIVASVLPLAMDLPPRVVGVL
jgi:putative phosphoesterase